MDYSFIYSRAFIDDLDYTIDYIQNTLNNKTAAKDLMNAFRNTKESIRLFPFAFQDCSIYLLLDKNVRHALIKNFVLIYSVDDNRKTITFLRIQFAGRNISDINIISSAD